MRIQLVKIKQLSGNHASIYSVIYENEETSLFEKFLYENIISFKSELDSILLRLKMIGTQTGAREQFFKMDEGNPGDGVCALYDDPGKKLRLYCVRYGTTLVIVGSGGHKPKTIRALQQDPKLKKENMTMRKISNLIKEKQEEGIISFSQDFYDFNGIFDLNDTDYE
jgi:putative component of toxin-antitoxin plasmid stabilization module